MPWWVARKARKDSRQVCRHSRRLAGLQGPRAADMMPTGPMNLHNSLEGIYVSIYVYIYIYTYTYVYIYTYMYIYIYIYTHVWLKIHSIVDPRIGWQATRSLGVTENAVVGPEIAAQSFFISRIWAMRTTGSAVHLELHSTIIWQWAVGSSQGTIWGTGGGRWPMVYHGIAMHSLVKVWDQTVDFKCQQCNDIPNYSRLYNVIYIYTHILCKKL